MKQPTIKDLMPFLVEFFEYNRDDVPDSVCVLWLDDIKFWYDEVIPKIAAKGLEFEKRFALMLEELIIEQIAENTEDTGHGYRMFESTEENLIRVRMTKVNTVIRWFALYNACDPHPVEYDLEQDDIGDNMPVKDWLENVECGGFIDYDGHGHPMRDGKMANMTIKPSRAALVPPDATHIQWYNK